MKIRIVIDTDIPKTMVETMRRTGFTLCQDGSGMQIKIPNSPAVPRRKVKVEYISEDQSIPLTKRVPNADQRQTTDKIAS